MVAVKTVRVIVIFFFFPSTEILDLMCHNSFATKRRCGGGRCRDKRDTKCIPTRWEVSGMQLATTTYHIRPHTREYIICLRSFSIGHPINRPSLGPDLLDLAGRREAANSGTTTATHPNNGPQTALNVQCVYTLAGEVAWQNKQSIQISRRRHRPAVRLIQKGGRLSLYILTPRERPC